MSPIELSIALLHIVLKLANIFPFIFPSIQSYPIHLILSPLSLINSTIWPQVHSNSLYIVVFKLSMKLRTFAPFQVTNPLFQSFYKWPNIPTMIGIGFNSMTMAFILSPLAIITATMFVLVRTFPVFLICVPFSFKHVTVCVNLDPTAVLLIHFPNSCVTWAIWPAHLTESFDDLVSPLADVLSIFW